MSIIKDDEIDLVELVRTIWRGRRVIMYSVILFVLIGLIVAYTSEKKYQASATILPSAEKKAGSLGSLGSLAGLAGINIGSMMSQSSSGIPSSLYPKVVASVPYLKELMNEKLTWQKYPVPMSVLEVMTQRNEKKGTSAVLKYTLRLPWTIKDALLGQPQEDVLMGSLVSDSTGYLMLTKQEQAAIGYLKAAIQVEQDKKSELVQLEVEVGEPLLAAQLADKAVMLLQRYVIDYKSKQAREQLQFIEKRYHEVKIEYEDFRNRFFEYRDRHRNMISERTDIEFQRINDTYDMASSVYKGLAQQLEQAKITVKEETPVFTVLEPVVVPKDKSAPKRGIIMAVSIFLGLFISIALVFVRSLYVID